jgi:hypothetical protein
MSGFLAPVLFVLMGIRTDLRAFAAPGVLGLALALKLSLARAARRTGVPFRPREGRRPC